MLNTLTQQDKQRERTRAGRVQIVLSMIRARDGLHLGAAEARLLVEDMVAGRLDECLIRLERDGLAGETAEEAYDRGYEAGETDVETDAYNQGVEDGKETGHSEGYRQGFAAGREAAKKQQRKAAT